MRATPLTLALGLTVVGPLALAAALGPSSAPPPAAEQPPMLAYWRAETREDGGRMASSLIARMTAYVRMNFPERPLHVLTNSLQGNDTVHWFMEFDDLPSRRQWERERDDDEVWQDITSAMPEAFRVEEDALVYLFHIAGPTDLDPNKTVRRITVTSSPQFRVPEARRFAARVVEYLEANYEGVDARAYSSDVHDPHAIYWTVDFENTATWDSIRRAMLADDGYVELLRGAEGLFDDDVRNELVLNY
jgi:hypothetical protein